MVKGEETLAKSAINGGMQDALGRNKKAWQEYKASGKDESMKEIKKSISCKTTKRKH